MSPFDVNDIEYPFTVTVKRPQEIFSENGNYQESFTTVIEGMTADIQLSLKVRKVASENETGLSDNMMWIMFCNPSETIRRGDMTYDGTRTFNVDVVGEWGSHTECVMRLV